MKGAAIPSIPIHRSVEIEALRDSGNVHRSDAIAIEEPLEIRLLKDGSVENGGTGRPISITMRTPGSDAELALGFLYGEGLLREPRDVVDVRPCGPTGNVMRVTVRADLPVDLDRLKRNFYTTSSCGVCGKASIEAVTANVGIRAIGGNLVVRESALRVMPDVLRAVQAGFAETGGMHAVGLFTADGELAASREDVGRHNAMDKLVGSALMHGELPWSNRIVLLSGRASFELLQKAMMAGAPLVAAIGAPSTLALELAQSAGITLVAFLRSGGCNVYCHPSRVRPARAES
jgi:FdhD protein